MAGEPFTSPYIDTSVFLGWANNEVIHGIDRRAIFQSVWDEAKAGAYKLYTSSITWAELFKLRHVPGTQPTPTIEAVLAMLEDPIVVPVEVDRDIGTASNLFCRIYRANNLYPNDAIHLACALEAKCDVLFSWDRPLNSVIHPTIRIETPFMRTPRVTAAQAKMFP